MCVYVCWIEGNTDVLLCTWEAMNDVIGDIHVEWCWIGRGVVLHLRR